MHWQMMWMFEDGMSALAKENSLHGGRDKTPYTEEELLASAAPPSATS